VIQPVIGFFESIWTSVSSFFVSLWEDIKTIWYAIPEWFDTQVIQPIIAFFR
jgi:hypothetical protein